MEPEPQTPQTPKTPDPPEGPPPRRRRRGGRIAIAVVLIAALVGVGGQFIGRGDGEADTGGEEVARGGPEGVAGRLAPTGPSAPAQRPEPASQPPAIKTEEPRKDQAAAAAAAPVPDVPPAEAPPSRTPPETPPANVPSGRPTVATPGPGADNGTPVPAVDRMAEANAEANDEAPKLDDDRFASLVSLVRSRAATRRFGEAFAVLAQLSSHRLTSRQSAAAEELQRELDRAVGSACRDILALAQDGAVLEARELAAAALRGGAPGFARELAAAFDAAGIGKKLQTPPKADRSRWPLPIPLAKDRLVRARLAAGEVEGSVIDSRSDRVTLRVRGERGMTFPTVQLVALEPRNVECAEAAELGFAAVQADDPLLARLWLGCALSRLPEVGCERAERLAELLR